MNGVTDVLIGHLRYSFKINQYLTINQKHTSVSFLNSYNLVSKSFILTENLQIRFLHCFQKFVHKRLEPNRWTAWHLWWETLLFVIRVALLRFALWELRVYGLFRIELNFGALSNVPRSSQKVYCYGLVRSNVTKSNSWKWLVRDYVMRGQPHHEMRLESEVRVSRVDQCLVDNWIYSCNLTLLTLGLFNSDLWLGSYFLEFRASKSVLGCEWNTCMKSGIEYRLIMIIPWKLSNDKVATRKIILWKCQVRH